MKIKKIKLSTALSDLYGPHGYQEKIVEGKRFWGYWADDSLIVREYGPDWYEIEVTYVRSGCMFYTFVKYPDMPEQYCPVNCFFTSLLVVSELDPAKDIPNLSNNSKFDRLTTYFNDEHTIIRNWDNSPEAEITEKEFNELTPVERFNVTFLYEK